MVTNPLLVKKLLLLVLFLYTASNLKSQSIVYFEDNQSGYGLEKTSDGNMIAIFDGEIRKLDINGTVLWEHYVPLLFSHRSVGIYNLDGGDIVFFINSHMYRYTLDGILVFDILIPEIYCEAIHQVTNGFQIVGHFGSLLKFMKVLDDGTITWNYSFDYDPDLHFGAMNSVGSNTLFLESGIFVPEGFNSAMIQFDTAGTVDFILHPFGTDYFDVAGLSEEVLLTRFDNVANYLQKYTTDVVPDWETISDPNTDSLLRIIKLESNNYVRLMEANGYNMDLSIMESYFYLEYYNQDGENIFTGEKFLNASNELFHILDFAQVGENKLAYTGHFGNTEITTAFILITDTLGVIHQLNVNGKVFYDENANAIFDAGEIDFENVFIQTDPGINFHITNFDGNYFSSLIDDGIYVNSCLTIPYWDLVEPSSYLYEVNEFTGDLTLSNNDFHLSYSYPVTEIYVSLYESGISLTTDGAEPDMNSAHITVKNLGNQVIDVLDLHLYYPMVNKLISIDPLYESHLDTIIVWTINNLKPFETQGFYALFEADSSIDYVGTTAYVKAELGYVADDIDLANNVASYSNVLDYSYDPNQLTVYPAGIGLNGNISPSVEWLEYQIEFENTGTGYAHDVVVVDTIEDEMVLSSIQMLASSHQFWMEFVSPNIIKWHFDDIELTPPAFDVIKSKGYLKFRIQINGHPPIGTQLSNTASIFFDKNLPIVTNTTINTIYLDMPVDSDIDPIYIFPNPTADHFTIYFNNATGPFDIVAISDITGKIISTYKVEENVYSMNLYTSVFAKGIYFIYYYNTMQKNIVATEKLIINN